MLRIVVWLFTKQRTQRDLVAFGESEITQVGTESMQLNKRGYTFTETHMSETNLLGEHHWLCYEYTFINSNFNFSGNVLSFVILKKVERISISE